MICLLVMTDGRRDCIERAIPSAEEHLHGPIERRVIHDDSADPAYRAWLADTFPAFDIIGQDTRQGFGGAIRSAWAQLPPTSYVFHLEDDFTFERRVELDAMASLLAASPGLAQIALRRQPVTDDEAKAGGVVEMWPDEYEQHHCDDAAWLEHRLFFTTNPSLYPRTTVDLGWPEGQQSERAMTDRLLSAGRRFAYWGERADTPWVLHDGGRIGTGY